MKKPSIDATVRLIDAIQQVLVCPELHCDEVEEKTRMLIEDVLETLSHVRREMHFPPRNEMVDYFVTRLGTEDRDTLYRRITALVGTISNEALYHGFDQAQKQDKREGKRRRHDRD